MEADVAAVAGEVRRQAGVPDILINNAGINIRRPLHEYTLEEWRRVMSTNVDGPFLCTRAFVPGMIEKKFGRIINVASTMAHVSLPHRAAYSGSKFAVLGMTKALALELAPYNITANAISPGPFATEIARVVFAGPRATGGLQCQDPLGPLGQIGRNWSAGRVPEFRRLRFYYRHRHRHRRRMDGAVKPRLAPISALW